MKKLRMNLGWFDTTYTVTCHADAGFSAFSASPASGAKDTTVTLTVTPASNKMLDEIEVVAGGVTIEESSGTYSFDIGTANVVLYAKSKSSKRYMVTENTFTCVNGSVVELTKNMMLEYNKNGAIVGVDCDGTEITLNDAIQNLIDAGVLVKM